VDGQDQNVADCFSQKALCLEKENLLPLGKHGGGSIMAALFCCHDIVLSTLSTFVKTMFKVIIGQIFKTLSVYKCSSFNLVTTSGCNAFKNRHGCMTPAV